VAANEQNPKSRLAALRQKRGLTQEQLARATGLSASVYWRLENGHYDNPPLRYLMNCKIALDCELDDLIEDEWREWMVLDRRYAAEPPRPEELWPAS
jgi:transcriptional regulator with XRE-family HTH domain